MYKRQPIGYTFFKKGEARFEDVGGGAVFTLAAWNGNEYAAVSSPFLLERETGKIRFIVPEAEKQELVVAIVRSSYISIPIFSAGKFSISMFSTIFMEPIGDVYKRQPLRWLWNTSSI